MNHKKKTNIPFGDTNTGDVPTPLPALHSQSSSEGRIRRSMALAGTQNCLSRKSVTRCTISSSTKDR